MILSLSLPLVLGWLLARRVVGETSPWVCAVLAVGLGTFVHLTLLNAALHVLPFAQACIAALGASGLAALGLLACTRAHTDLPARDAQPPVSLPETLAFALALATIAYFSFLSLSTNICDDFFIHVANWALFTRDVFPLVNAYFPDVTLHGHYGRDLVVEGFAWSAGVHPFLVLYLTVLVGQACTWSLLYVTFRRQSGSPVQAFLATALTFFGMHVGFSNVIIRAGLFDVFRNNMAVTHLHFAVILFLLARTWTAATLSVSLLCAILLGTYQIVYETMFAAIVPALLAVGLFDWRKDAEWRRRILAHSIVIAAVAVGLAAVEGGVITHVVASRLSPPAVTESLTSQGISQGVTVRFPKDPAGTIYVPGGAVIGVLSGAFLGDQGLGYLLLPLTVVFTALRPQPVSIFLLVFGFSSIGAAAFVDFGRFNAESLRLVFAAGVGFTASLGLTLGALWTAAYRRFIQAAPRPARVAFVLTSVALLSFPFSISAEKMHELLVMVRDSPQFFIFSFDGRLVANSQTSTFSRDDLALLQRLREISLPGERLLANPPLESKYAPLGVSAIAVGISGCPVVGSGIVPKTAFDMEAGMEPKGCRSLVFWQTLDPRALRALKAQWLYVFPSELSADTREQLDRAPFLRRTITAPGEGLHARTVYEVRTGALPRLPAPDAPPPVGLEITSVHVPSVLKAREVVPLRVALTNRGTQPVSTRGWAFGLDLHNAAQTLHLNANDEVTVALPDARIAPGGTVEITIPLTLHVPYEAVTLRGALFDDTGRRVAEVPTARGALPRETLRFE